MKTPDIETVYKNIHSYSQFFSPIFKEIKKDFEFYLGKQWEADDVDKLENAKVKPLTINKIKPMIKLISGIERQSRADYKAFPEGTEDELLSEIATRLLKNVEKQSRLKHKTSEQFKDGMVGGACYIEPYIDYTQDLIDGEMKFRKVAASRILFDPNSEEYDLSDSKAIIKLTFDLSKEDLMMLFPGKSNEAKIDSVSESKIDLMAVDSDLKQDTDYSSVSNMNNIVNQGKEDVYDLIEYYYKSPYKIYYVVSMTQGILLETENENEAKDFIASRPDLVDGSIVEKNAYEIRLKQIVGKTEFTDERASTFPKWKGYPIIPFFADKASIEMRDSSLAIQGVVRSLRDLQEEYNKRRTQELRHLNSSVNSGMFIPKDALDSTNKANLRDFGASPGVRIFYDPAKTGGASPDMWRVSPTPLSQGHAQLAIENAQDIKEASGINPDLLANDSQSQSGRAILLKQRQGLVMVQESLDNYQQTKEILGRFILSQLGEVYSIESAMRVLGDGFIKQNFRKPVFEATGDPRMSPDGQLETETDIDMARMMINKVLSDSSIGKYDVTIGEGAFNETIQMANFSTLLEMAGKGIPVPPDVIISESLLSAGQKEKILESIQKQAAMAANVQAQEQPQRLGMDV